MWWHPGRTLLDDADRNGIGTMTSGTLQPSLTAGAARPDSAGSRVAPAAMFGSHATCGRAHLGFTSISANQMWLQVWNIDAKPAYLVAHTDRTIPRPPERSP